MASRWLAIDKPLFATTVAMMSFGLLMVYSSSFHLSQQAGGSGTSFLIRQAAAAAIGLGVMFAWFSWRIVIEPTDADARRLLLASVVYLPILLIVMMIDCVKI